MYIKNIGIGCGWYDKSDSWKILPSLELQFMGRDNQIFTKNSWNLVFSWLKAFAEIGYLKLRKKEE